MGGSSKQVTGYQYFANFLLFIGNPIEKLLGINFDKRGWAIPLLDDQGNPLDVGTINKPNLFGENEGGIAGQIHARYGIANPMPVSFYTDYLAENDLPPLAYPFQSYLAFEDFYLGNSGYPKEMLLWPKRIHVKNDGSPQWHDSMSEIPSEITSDDSVSVPYLATIGLMLKDDIEENTSSSAGFAEWDKSLAFNYILTSSQIDYAGNSWDDNNPEHNSRYKGDVTGGFNFIGSSQATTKIFFTLHTDGARDYAYVPMVYFNNQSVIEFSVYHVELTGNLTRHEYSITFFGDSLSVNITCKPHQISINQQSNRIFPLSVQVFYPDVYKNISYSGDINPVHKIREILTDDTAMNMPESDINDVNFAKAADRIWEEKLGISWAITEKSCVDAINELCSHIEAGIRVNRQTGLYEMVLFRDDWFKEDEIHTLAESKIKSISFEVQNADDVVNQLNVSYYDRNNIKNASFSISENASIKNMSGRVNAESSDFPYFMNQRNAAVVAQWKLKQFTTPCWKGSFTTGHNQARKWNRYEIVKLNWSRKGIIDLPVRIMSINLGDGIDNTVSIDFVEVVPFSDELASSVVIDDKIDVTPLPPQPILFKAFELSYFEAVQAHGQRRVDEELAYNPDAGYVAVVAQRTQNNSLNAQMHTDAGAGYENSAVIQYCETAQLDQSIDRLASSFIVKKVGGLASVRIGSQIFINNEIMVFQDFDAASKLLTVKRGALDTIPQTHADDSLLFFTDDFVAVDSTEYAEGEAIDVKALSTTPSGILDLSGSDTQTVTIHSRAIRPYPPANVEINGVYYPESLIVTNDIVLTWVDRNRVQQTGGEILGFYDAGVTKEIGVTYGYELSSEGLVLDSGANIATDTVTLLSSVLIQNKPHTLKLWSERGGYSSYQTFEHAFFVESASLILTATATKSQVSGNTVHDANITVNVDETLKANMIADGSGISGKAQAGATITINIEE